MVVVLAVAALLLLRLECSSMAAVQGCWKAVQAMWWPRGMQYSSQMTS